MKKILRAIFPFLFRNKEVDGNVTFWKGWKNDEVKFAYILMSKKIGPEEFQKIFPKAEQIKEKEFEQLHNMENGPEIVTVGDDTILNEYFPEGAIE